MNKAYRFLLTVNATSLLLIVFMVQKGYTLGHFFAQYAFITELPNAVSYGFYLTIPVLLTKFSLFLSQFLGKDSFEIGHVTGIEHANNSFLPSYLGYFFVALSVGNCETLWFVYGVLFVFTFRSQALYFNPLFLLFGFDFYTIKTVNGASIFLISKNKYKTPAEIDIPVAYRINNHTYLEKI